MSDLDDFLELRRTAERLAREEARLGGERDALLRKLGEHGCRTPGEGRAKLRELEKQERAAAGRFGRLLDRFRKRWEGKLK